MIDRKCRSEGLLPSMGDSRARAVEIYDSVDVMEIVLLWWFPFTFKNI